MTIREFAKLNNFPIRGKLTRIPDEVEYDFNDRPHNCKRYVDEDTYQLVFIGHDFTMLGYTAYQFSIVGPFALVCFFGAAVMWFSGIR